ncbi:MAG: hypothetical protein ACREOO_31530 [bacterium]
MNRRFAMLLRPAAALALVTAAVTIAGLATSGCDQTAPKESRHVMIFIDMSLSTLPDRDNYKKYIEKIVSKLKAGDRLTVCKIIDLTIADFSPIFDITFPSFSMWSDNRTRYDKSMREISRQLIGTVDSVLASRFKVQKNEIVNSFLICDQIKNGKPGRKSLVIISDMQESSSELDFDKDHLTTLYLDNAIATLRSKGRIPHLEGIDVWMAGAYAKDTEKFFAVQEFWKRYVAATGATLRSYSHTLLDFE